MNPFLIVANWKMNPETLNEARSLACAIKEKKGLVPDVETVICPPFPFLSGLADLSERNISFGAQDVFWKGKGAFTGEVSPVMLTSLGCKWVIIGHSERRRFLGETDMMIAQKVRAALQEGLRPILCIGEEIREGEGGDFSEVGRVLETQLTSALQYVPRSQIENLTITYEPVWAISSGKGGRADSPEDALKAVVFIRKMIHTLFHSRLFHKVRILYGGSVSKENAEKFFAEEGIEGALVGSASLKPDNFAVILQAAQRCWNKRNL